jgi:hypothetical protein
VTHLSSTDLFSIYWLKRPLEVVPSDVVTDWCWLNAFHGLIPSTDIWVCVEPKCPIVINNQLFSR